MSKRWTLTTVNWTHPSFLHAPVNRRALRNSRGPTCATSRSLHCLYRRIALVTAFAIRKCWLPSPASRQPHLTIRLTSTMQSAASRANLNHTRSPSGPSIAALLPIRYFRIRACATLCRLYRKMPKNIRWTCHTMWMVSIVQLVSDLWLQPSITGKDESAILRRKLQCLTQRRTSTRLSLP